ncbi:trace amine-associated receptor 1 [Sergentomyia squamirostris]
MDPKAGVWLVAPSVRNASCSHPRYSASSLWTLVGPVEAIQSFLVFTLAVGIIGANLMVILVINNRRYSPYIHPQSRYLLTSLALNDLAIGVLITPFGVVSALFHCWAFGEVVCQIQALLRGALSQQSAVILICMAIDRYLCCLYPERYHHHSSKKKHHTCDVFTMGNMKSGNGKKLELCMRNGIDCDQESFSGALDVISI